MVLTKAGRREGEKEKEIIAQTKVTKQLRNREPVPCQPEQDAFPSTSGQPAPDNQSKFPNVDSQ